MSLTQPAAKHNFATVPVPLTASEVGNLARAIYVEEIAGKLTPQDDGKFLTLDIFSHDYELGKEDRETLERLRKRQPEGRFYSMRVGQKVFGRL